MLGGAERRDERRARVVLHHAQKTTHVADPRGGCVTPERGEVLSDLGRHAQELLLLLENWRSGRAALAARRAMALVQDSCAHGIDELLVRRDLSRSVVDVDLALGLADLEPPPEKPPRRRVAVGVDGHEALHVDDALMKGVHLRHPRWQGTQPRLLGDKELARTGMQVTAVSGVDAIAPRDRLAVQRLPVGEFAPDEKVVLDVVEGPLDPCRAIGIPLLVRFEDEAEALAEALHLRHRHHRAPRAGEHDDMGVVDHARRAGAAEVAQRIGEEDLAVEAGERGVVLDEDHP